MMPKQGVSSTPVFDLKILMETQRKNVQAVTDAVQAGMEGMQQALTRQAELVGRIASENSNIATQLMTEGTPEQKVQRQAELMRRSYEETIQGAREVGEIISKSQEEAAEIINRRVTASLSEFKFAFDTRDGLNQARRASDAAWSAAETATKAANSATQKTAKKAAKVANRSRKKAKARSKAAA
ncbi:MAG TPA: phasin family protein [Alphaproteobacteria bacterium]